MDDKHFLELKQKRIRNNNMDSSTKRFLQDLLRLNIFGFVVIGLILLHGAEARWKFGEKGQEKAYLDGQLNIRNEAIRLGYGRMEGTNFVWSTNIFSSLNSMNLAINSVLESERRAKEMTGLCMRGMEITLETAEVMKKLNAKEASTE